MNVTKVTEATEDILEEGEAPIHIYNHPVGSDVREEENKFDDYDKLAPSKLANDVIINTDCSIKTYHQ